MSAHWSARWRASTQTLTWVNRGASRWRTTGQLWREPLEDDGTVAVLAIT